MRGVLILLVLILLIFSISLTSCNTINQNNFNNIDSYLKNLLQENINLKKEVLNLSYELENEKNSVEYLSEQLNKVQKSFIKKSPYDWIKGENIILKDNEIIIELDNAVISDIANTHSLEPLIDEYSNVIEIIPQSNEDIHIGDIIAYKSEFTEGIILHRVISIDIDDKGWYAILKGDNNPNFDPGRIRFNQIKRVVVGIIY